MDINNYCKQVEYTPTQTPGNIRLMNSNIHIVLPQSTLEISIIILISYFFERQSMHFLSVGTCQVSSI